jgi:hypothetical protein
VYSLPRAVIVAARSIAFAPLLASAACGSPDRPSGTAETGSEIRSDDVDTSAAGGTSAIGEPGMGARACTPRALRECHLYFTDDFGNHHCPLSYQICALDGADWLPCGEYRVGPGGDPVPSP